MADYDPFARGSNPVGVRTIDVHDADRDRTVPVEAWYPATEVHAGQDSDAETMDSYEVMPGAPAVTQKAVRDARGREGPHPAVVFSHGFSGHRRQSTHLCTHLASHGYVVAAPDHVGNTLSDVMASIADPERLQEATAKSIEDRPNDASRVLDALRSGELGVEVDSYRAGITGHSFGGWTTLQTTGRDERFTSALPLAPAGGFSGKGPPADTFAERLELAWERSVPTLMLVADEDSVLPLAGMHDLFERAPSVDQMVVLVNADHFHFCDNAEAVHDMMAPMMGGQTKKSSEFIPGSDAYTFTTGLGLAHFDATLRQLDDAVVLMRRNLADVMAERGIKVEATRR